MKQQVAFRITKSLKKRIQIARVTRGLTFQDFFTAAVEQALTPTKRSVAAKPTNKDVNEYNLSELWLACLNSLPIETLDCHIGLMRDNLKFFRASRIRSKPCNLVNQRKTPMIGISQA